MHSVFLASESRSEFRGRLGMAVIAMHTDGDGPAVCCLSRGHKVFETRLPTSREERG